MKVDGKNKHKLYIRDCHNCNGSALFGGFVGGAYSEKLEKLRFF